MTESEILEKFSSAHIRGSRNKNIGLIETMMQIFAYCLFLAFKSDILQDLNFKIKSILIFVSSEYSELIETI